MPMDGLTIRAVTSELTKTVLGARIDRINQPEDDEIVLFCRNNGTNHKLLLCTNADFARLSLTEAGKPNQPTPPVFCMLLRKHLTGARIKELHQFGNERIVRLTFDTLNDFNEPDEKRLYLEIMGKYSNLILTDREDKILDCIRRVNSLMSRVRQLAPGLTYVFPPSQDKQDPFSSFPPLSDFSARKIADTFTGFSRPAAAECAYQCEKHGFEEGMKRFLAPYLTEKYEPVILLDENGEAADYFAVPQERCEPVRQEVQPSLSAALDRFYLLRDRARRLHDKARDTQNKLTLLKEKAEKNAALQQEKLRECADAETYRIRGELLTANLYRVPRGASSVTLENYYDDSASMTIPLDSSLSPAVNAQKYFKKYNKLKTAARLLNDQIARTQEELALFEELSEDLDKCETVTDIADIRGELISRGYLKAPKGKQKQEKSRPMHFISSTGKDIFVGKNSRQNDELTLHFASPDDLWLHVKDYHGSHVILHDSEHDEASVREAAILAAYYSAVKGEAAVDAALKKYVRKPSGAAPGAVIYTRQTTYYINAEEKTVRQIRKV